MLFYSAESTDISLFIVLCHCSGRPSLLRPGSAASGPSSLLLPGTALEVA